MTYMTIHDPQFKKTAQQPDGKAQPTTPREKAPITVMIIDDQPAVIKSLTALLDETQIAYVIAADTHGRSALSTALRIRPDVIVTDVSMPDMNGIEITREMIAVWPAAKILAVSAHSNSLYVEGMMSAGARGYLLKDLAANELLDALQALVAGRTWIGEGVFRQ